MAKDKSGGKTGAAVAPVKAKANKAIEKVQKTAKAVGKKSKKEPTPDPTSESESETSASSDSSDEEDEVDIKKPQVNGKANGKAKAPVEEDDDTSSGSDSDEEAAPKLNGAAKEDSDDDSESDDEPAPKRVEKKLVAPKTNGKAPAKVEDASDSDDDDESDSDADEKPSAVAKKVDEDDDSSDDDESESDEEEEEKPKVQESKKRKADSEPEQTPKKAKTEDPNATGNLFIGNLSWNVDEEWLTREFEEFGELSGVRIITDRESGRSKGFGYIEFVDPADAAKALEAKNGADLDNRQIRLDFSTPRQKDGENGTPQQRSQDRRSKFGDTPSEPSATLFVGNLSFEASEDMVREYFEEHGSVNSIRLPTDRETGAPKGFGYVEMTSIDEAKAAFDSLQGADLGGRPLRLDYAAPRPPRDDSRGGFGGGRGGGRGFGGDRGGRGGRGGGRGGFGDRGGRGGGRGGFNDRGRGGGRGGSTNRGGFGDFQGKKISF